MRRNLASGLVSLTLVAAGLALVAVFLVGFPGGGGDTAAGNKATNGGEPGSFNVPELDASRQEAGGPEDKTLKLTVPEMKRVENVTIPTREPDEEALKNNVAVRLPSTGLPWEDETNVYIAGHELGYPSTESYRAFYDLKKLEKGDEVYLSDADGRQYTYEVFEILIIQPDDFWVLDPLEGRNIVSLQGSETQQQVGDNIPKRVVRAGLKDVEE